MQIHDTENLGTTTRWVLVAFFVIIGSVAAWLIKDVIMLTLAAVILSVLIGMPIHFLVRRGIRRGLAVLISIITSIVVTVALVLWLMPGLLQQFAQLGAFIPQAIEDLQALINSGELLSFELPIIGQVDFDPNHILGEIDLQSVTEQLTSAAGTISSTVFPLLGGVANVLFSLLVVIFMSLYFVSEPETYRRGVVRLVPKVYRRRADEILQHLALTLQNFLQAQIALMVFIGVVTTIALGWLGVPLAPTLGILTGLFSFVPNFGPIAALIPVLAVTIVNTPEQWLLVIVVFYGLQLIASQVVAPVLMSEQINMPAISVLLGQIIAGIFFGFVGLLLAVPLTAIVVVLVQEIYVKDILGDRDNNLPEVDDALLPDGV